MAIDPKVVMQLREQSGAGMMDAKRSLEEAGGDLEKAMDLLRKKGLVKAAQKAAERSAKEGLIGSYIHATGKVGVLLQLNCETDFVARNEKFAELMHNVCLHIAASNPQYVRREDVPADVVEKEKNLAREMMADQKKPAEMVEKIVEGKMNTFFAEICLAEQKFILDDAKTVAEIVAAASATIGEKIEIGRFTRFQISK